MKTNILKTAIILIIMAFSANSVFSQGNTYKLSGNNNGTSNSKLGWKNYADLNIVTNDSARVIIGKNGNVEIKKNFVVDGKIKGDSIQVNSVTCDSMKITNYLTADSIHVSSIKIGDSSLWIGGNPTGSLSDLIQSNHPSIGFGRIGLFFAKLRLGIGTPTPNYKLSLFDRNYLFGGPAPAVYESFNNLGFGISPGTGNLSTDCFLVGINPNGDAQLIQQEDHLPISFHTNMGGTTGERMRIINNEIFTNNFMRMTITEDINNLNYASASGALGPVLGTLEFPYIT